jgi:hypothetical protein
MLKNLDEHLLEFFRTDHHWNIRGAWRAYQGIHNLLAQGFEAIGPQLKAGAFEPVPGGFLYGSLFRKTLYPLEPDVLEAVRVDLPDYSVEIDGEPVEIFQDDLINADELKQNPYLDTYGRYWGKTGKLRHYHFENASTRNLLIFGDSYANSVGLFIASHYHETYVVDLRFNLTFDYSAFVEENQIDDVLILGTPGVLFTWNIQP